MRHSGTQIQLPQALVGAFHDAHSRTGQAAREMMARLLADEASRDATREALFAALEHTDPHIRGTCALILLQSGEGARPQLLRALMGTFHHPDADTGRAARELIASMLADKATRQWTRDALVTGLSDEIPNVRKTCDELLQTAG